MANIRDIRKRIKAVGNIQRITRTMQMIATAKFQASVRRAQATQPFSDKLAEIVAELAEAAGDVDHPLLGATPRPSGRKMLLVLSSNRGLCGAYNAGVLREAHRFIRNSSEQILLDVAGKKGIAYFRFAEIPIAGRHTEFDDKTPYEQVEALGESYIQRYLKGEFDELSVAYTRFISNARQTPEVVKILPMEKPQAEAESEKPGANAVFEFSPAPRQLLDDLLPLAVKTRLFQFFNDANVSEQISRMVAMKSATDNAGKMRGNLKRQFNRARQSQITTELSEIIGGAAALE